MYSEQRNTVQQGYAHQFDIYALCQKDRIVVSYGDRTGNRLDAMKSQIRDAMPAFWANLRDARLSAAVDHRGIFSIICLTSSADIAGTEKDVDMDVLICACLLHDIGRREQFEDSRVCHARAGADKAYRFLRCAIPPKPLSGHQAPAGRGAWGGYHKEPIQDQRVEIHKKRARPFPAGKRSRDNLYRG